MNDLELIEVRRKAFEAWAAISGLSVTRSTVDMMFGSGARVSAGEYFQPTELAWRSWSAALDSVVVELPVKISSCNVSASGFVNPNAEHYDEAIDDCAEAIHAAGIKTKVMP